MKSAYIRRRYRRPAAKDPVAPKKDSQSEQQFFGDKMNEPFFKPAEAMQQSVQRKCADCEKEDRVQRAQDKKEEEKVTKKEEKKEDKVQRVAAKNEEDNKVQKKEDKKEEEKVMKKEEKKEDDKIQKKEVTGSTGNTTTTASNYISSINSKGQSIDAGVQSFYENRIGADFRDVKIHTGKEAAESATDINAQAYAYENHIVFNEGKYQPQTAEGQHLLAHELAHVVQQGKSSKIIQRQPAVTCDRGIVSAARSAAAIRVQVLLHRLRGLHPMLGAQQQQDALRLARQIIAPTVTLATVTDVINRMLTALTNDNRVVCGPEIPECAGWRAYVVDNRPPLHTCNSFFGLNAIEQRDSLIHEAAHAAGIGQAASESYYMVYDCSSISSFADVNVADSWAYFVICASS